MRVFQGWLGNVGIAVPGRIISKGAVCIEGGHIAAVREGDSPRQTVDGGGLLMLPGLIDVHGDMLEQILMPRPAAPIALDCAVHELDRQLVSNGITTAFAAVGLTWEDYGESRTEAQAEERIAALRDPARRLMADHRVHARFAVTNPEFAPWLERRMASGDVHMVSLIDHTPGQGQFRDEAIFRSKALAWRNARTGAAWSAEELNDHIVKMRARPKDWETVRHVAGVAQQYGVCLCSHDDDTPERVAHMKDFGVTVSEFPVTLAAAQAAQSRGMHVIMGAPNALRGASAIPDNFSAAEGIGAGCVDVLASDYFPPALLQGVFTLAQRGVLPLADAVDLVSRNPARVARLDDRGSIVVGGVADFILVDVEGQPRVRATVRNGIPVYNDGFSPFI